MKAKEPRHNLSCKDLDSGTAICSVCGKTDLYFFRARGEIVQTSCLNKRRKIKVRHRLKKRRPYRLDMDLSVCAICGFIPQDPCQIDIDHKNADHSDDTPSNLQAICANCHRLKSRMEQLIPKIKAPR